mgnify:CR=1 FL=1
MAQNLWVAGFGIADAALGEIVQIAAADADGVHLHLHVARRRIFNRPLGKGECFKSAQFSDHHDCRGRPPAASVCVT